MIFHYIAPKTLNERIIRACIITLLDIIVAGLLLILFAKLKIFQMVMLIKIVFVTLQILRLIFYFRNRLWSFLFYHAYEKPKLIEAAVQRFAHYSFPKPFDANMLPRDYFLWIANNDDLDGDIRLSAAKELGFLEYSMSGWYHYAIYHYEQALQHAIKTYQLS